MSWIARVALLTGCALAASGPGAAQSDEANRQRAMGALRDQAASADRSAFDAAMARQNNASAANRSSASSGQPVGNIGGTGSTAYANATGANHASTGPQSVVASRTITIRAADAPQLVLARLEQRARGGDGAAAYDLGRILNSDYPLPHDHARARSMFALGAKAGHSGAQASYGYMLVQGMGGAADRTAGADWLQRSSEAGDRFGRFRYGMLLLDDYAKPGFDAAPMLRWLTLSADAGELGAQAALGIVYFYGMGVPADNTKAARYLKLASDAGEVGSTGMLGRIYAQGQGGGTPQEGYQLIRRASDGGDVEAQRFYGQMLLNGVGFPIDKPAGAALIKRAAGAGDAVAAGLLGSMYADGDGVAQDDALALRWWGIAAKRGNEGAKAQIAALPADQRRIAEAATE